MLICPRKLSELIFLVYFSVLASKDFQQSKLYDYNSALNTIKKQSKYLLKKMIDNFDNLDNFPTVEKTREMFETFLRNDDEKSASRIELLNWKIKEFSNVFDEEVKKFDQ